MCYILPEETAVCVQALIICLHKLCPSISKAASFALCSRRTLCVMFKLTEDLWSDACSHLSKSWFSFPQMRDVFVLLFCGEYLPESIELPIFFMVCVLSD